MTKTETQLQTLIDNSRISDLSRSWSRDIDQIEAARTSLFTRRMGALAAVDFDEEL